MLWMQQLVCSAMDREAARVRQALRRGFGVWATTAAVAPLVGLFVNFCEIAGSFTGPCCSADSLFLCLVGRMAEACIPTAFSLLPAIFGCWALHYFEGELERMDTEMGLAKSLLVRQLLLLRRPHE
jgi:biopolymer transport protein ExbB/TolQ